MNDRDTLDAGLRRYLSLFIRKAYMTLEPGRALSVNWHQDAIAYQLERVARGECRRLIITVPPRSLKSISVSVAFPAWVMGHNPTLKVMCVSYAQELSRTHAEAFRTVIGSDWYRRAFRAFAADPKNQRMMELATTARGFRLATSVGGTVTGKGADIIIIDDPIKPDHAYSETLRRKANEFYDNTLYSRLNDKTTGAIVIVMQRLHEEDLVGHVLAQEEWEVLSIPSIETEDREYQTGPGQFYRRRAGEVLHPDREPQMVLEAMKRTLGSLGFSAQYQQQPLPQEGNIVKRQWLRFYDERPKCDLVVVSWDTASTLEDDSDYSVGTVWGLHDGTIYLLEVLRDRWEVPDLRRVIEATHKRWNAAATLIEDSDIGRAVNQDLRRSKTVLPITYRPRFDKVAWMLVQSPKFEAGQVVLPRQAPWLAEYMKELLGFPNTQHDDQVDSTSQALDWLSGRIAAGIPPARPDPVRPAGRLRRRP